MELPTLNSGAPSQMVGERDNGGWLMKLAEEHHSDVLVKKFSKSENSSLCGRFWKLIRRIVGLFCLIICCSKSFSKRLDGRVAEMNALLSDFYAACKAGNIERVSEFFHKIPAHFVRKGVKGPVTIYPLQEGLKATLSGTPETKETRLAIAKLLIDKDCSPWLPTLKMNEEGVGDILTKAIESEDYQDFFPLLIEKGADINAGHYVALSSPIEAGDLDRFEFILSYPGINFEKPLSYPPLKQVFGMIKDPTRRFSLEVCCAMANRLLEKGAQLSKTITSDFGYGPSDEERQSIYDSIVANGNQITLEIAQQYLDATKKPNEIGQQCIDATKKMMD